MGVVLTPQASTAATANATSAGALVRVGVYWSASRGNGTAFADRVPIVTKPGTVIPSATEGCQLILQGLNLRIVL